ncbi:Ribosomal RNA small subunit methyltransferase F [Cronobacter sakazakii 701]|nr:Ribosomal RNA small subunit methyltransferase F [Cronobacter sakazakii 701]
MLGAVRRSFADGNTPARVMDVAAAPGSKTTQIAALMQNQGFILANEYSASRVKVLHANISRCGIHNVGLTHFDGRVFGAALPEQFNAILLDAPCSGEGVVRKDPDALRNWSPQSNQEIAATQRELIESAFHALAPGGTLVYSTCTLNREENQETERCAGCWRATRRR